MPVTVTTLLFHMNMIIYHYYYLYYIIFDYISIYIVTVNGNVLMMINVVVGETIRIECYLLIDYWLMQLVDFV